MPDLAPPPLARKPPRWIGWLFWTIALLWIAVGFSVAYGNALFAPATPLLYLAGFYSLSVKTSSPTPLTPILGVRYLAAGLALLISLCYAITEPDWYVLWYAGAASLLALLLSHWPTTNGAGRWALALTTLLGVVGPGYCARYTKLHPSIRAGNAAHVALLLRFGADANLLEQQDRPLATAVDANRPDIMEQLLRAGADPNGRTTPASNSGSALISAARSSDSMPLQVLLNHGADPNLANGHGETALFHAARWGQLFNVRHLLEAGATTNRRNKQGQRPLDAAREWDSKGDIVRLLQQAGNKLPASNGQE